MRRDTYLRFLPLSLLLVCFVIPRSDGFPISPCHSIQGQQRGSGGALQSSKSDSSNDKQKVKKASLYELLQSPSTATREQLKQKYIVLAKQLHPDSQDSTSVVLESSPSFSDVSSAWRILSDPKERRSYDRTLRAEAFTDNVDRVMEESAGPTIKNIFETMAVPLLRRTTATTAAVFTAATEDFSNGGEDRSNLQSIFGSVMKAAKGAGKVVDRMELWEKSKELEDRAEKESDEFESVRDKLDVLRDEKFRLWLNLPKSPLTAKDSAEFLERRNITSDDKVNFIVENLLRKHNVGYEIDSLKETEADHQIKINEQSDAEKIFLQKKRELDRIEKNVQKAMEARETARKALRDSICSLNTSRDQLTDKNREIAKHEPTYKKNIAETEKSAAALEKQREQVRKLLKRKDDEHLQALNNLPPSQIDDTNTQNEEAVLNSLKKLQQEERALMAKSSDLKNRIFRLRSRANKLNAKGKSINIVDKEEKVQVQPTPTPNVVKTTPNTPPNIPLTDTQNITNTNVPTIQNTTPVSVENIQTTADVINVDNNDTDVTLEANITTVGEINQPQTDVTEVKPQEPVIIEINQQGPNVTIPEKVVVESEGSKLGEGASYLSGL